MLSGYYDHILLGVEVFAVAGDGNVRHLSVCKAQSYGFQLPAQVVLIGFCLKFANGPHEPGVAVGRIGRESDVIIVMLELKGKL